MSFVLSDDRLSVFEAKASTGFPNKYPGTCSTCGDKVPSGEGHTFKDKVTKKWKVFHPDHHENGIPKHEEAEPGHENVVKTVAEIPNVAKPIPPPAPADAVAQYNKKKKQKPRSKANDYYEDEDEDLGPEPIQPHTFDPDKFFKNPVKRARALMLTHKVMRSKHEASADAGTVNQEDYSYDGHSKTPLDVNNYKPEQDDPSSDTNRQKTKVSINEGIVEDLKKRIKSGKSPDLAEWAKKNAQAHGNYNYVDDTPKVDSDASAAKFEKAKVEHQQKVKDWTNTNFSASVVKAHGGAGDHRGSIHQIRHSLKRKHGDDYTEEHVKEYLASEHPDPYKFPDSVKAASEDAKHVKRLTQQMKSSGNGPAPPEAKDHLVYKEQEKAAEDEVSDQSLHQLLTDHVDESVRQWAASAADAQMKSVAMQIAARNHFDLPEDTLKHVENYGSSGFGGNSTWNQAQQHYEKHKAFHHHFLDSVYQDTQKKLKEAGISHLILHRGHSANSPDSVTKNLHPTPSQKYDKPPDENKKINMQPLSSWTSSELVQHQFSHGEYAHLFHAAIPAKHVFSLSSGTGPGCLHEREALVIGGKGNAKVRYKGDGWASHAYHAAHTASAASDDDDEYPNIDAGINEDWIKGRDIDSEGNEIIPAVHMPPKTALSDGHSPRDSRPIRDGVRMVYGEDDLFNRNPQHVWGCATCGIEGKKNYPAYAPADKALQRHRSTSDHYEKSVNRHKGYNETRVPPEVDTLRDDTCPVCGETTEGSDKCPVCGYEVPPSMYQDPDVGLAKQLRPQQNPLDDLQNSDQPLPDLQCSVCGSQFSSAGEEDAAGNPHLAPAKQTKSPEQEAMDDQEDQEEALEVGQDGQPGTEIQTGPDDIEGQEDTETDPDNPDSEPKKKSPNPFAKKSAKNPFAKKDDEDSDFDEDPDDDDPDAQANPDGLLGYNDDEDPSIDQSEDATDEQLSDPTTDSNGQALPGEAGLSADSNDPSANVDDPNAMGDPGMGDPTAENDVDDTGYNEGDQCPVCQEGILEPLDPNDVIDPNEPPQPDAANPTDVDPNDPKANLNDTNPDPDADPSDLTDPTAEDEDAPAGQPVVEDPDADPTDPKDPTASTDDEDDDDEESDKDPDGDDSENPFVKKKSTIANRHEGVEVMPNPAQEQRSALLTAINAQAQMIRHQASIIEAQNVRSETLERQMAFIADAAGIAEPLAHIGIAGQRKVAAIMKRANPANPAQPVEEPPPEAPVATNQTAMQPGARDDVTQLGASPLTDVSADATTAVDQPYGELANTPVGMNRVDVTAPVEGTQEQRPPNETIIPVDVRIGNPDNPQPAFPWMMGPVGARPPAGVGPAVTSSLDKDSGRRTMACLHLARLQINAGMIQGNDLEFASHLAQSDFTDRDIQIQIDTIAKMPKIAQQQASNGSQRLVPKAASREQRSTPSMAGSPMPTVGSPFAISSDEIAFE